MTRWYLSPMVGDGFILPKRALVQDLMTLLPTPRTCTITKSFDGSDAWALVDVTAPSFPVGFDDPAIALIASSADFDLPTSPAMDAALLRFGVVRDVRDTVTKRVLLRLGQRLQPTFRSEHVDKAAIRG